jgi:hypothetical protein
VSTIDASRVAADLLAVGDLGVAQPAVGLDAELLQARAARSGAGATDAKALDQLSIGFVGHAHELDEHPAVDGAHPRREALPAGAQLDLPVERRKRIGTVQDDRPAAGHDDPLAEDREAGDARVRAQGHVGALDRLRRRRREQRARIVVLGAAVVAAAARDRQGESERREHGRRQPEEGAPAHHRLL